MEYPPGIAAAVELYKGAMVVGAVGQGADALSSAAKGDGTGFVLESTSIFVGEVTGGWLDKIPGVSDVTKITAKTAAEAAIDAGKDKAKEELKKE